MAAMYQSHNITHYPTLRLQAKSWPGLLGHLSVKNSRLIRWSHSRCTVSSSRSRWTRKRGRRNKKRWRCNKKNSGSKEFINRCYSRMRKERRLANPIRLRGISLLLHKKSSSRLREIPHSNSRSANSHHNCSLSSSLALHRLISSNTKTFHLQTLKPPCKHLHQPSNTNLINRSHPSLIWINSRPPTLNINTLNTLNLLTRTLALSSLKTMLGKCNNKTNITKNTWRWSECTKRLSKRS